jgi:hypothetical protein
MLFVRCAFCHKLVFRPLYCSHRAKHTRPLRNGQMTDHITVHPKGRHQGSLQGVPRSYRHPRCGVATGIPEEIIRSYLVNPFLYSGGSFCCGCNDYMLYEELFWVETGQSLADYFRELQVKYVRVHGTPPPRRRVQLGRQTLAEPARYRIAAKHSELSNATASHVSERLEQLA